MDIEKCNIDHKLIVIIIKKGMASFLMNKLKKAGAEGETVFFGKGAAEKSIYEKVLGIEYQPEKEIILIATKEELVDNILDSAVKNAHLDKPGNGIAFVLDLKKCVGISRLLKELNIN